MKAGRDLKHFYEARCSLSGKCERQGGPGSPGRGSLLGPLGIRPSPRGEAARPCPADRPSCPERGSFPAGLLDLLSCYKKHVAVASGSLGWHLPSWGRCLARVRAGRSAGPAGDSGSPRRRRPPRAVFLLGFFTRAPNARATSGPAVPVARHPRGAGGRASSRRVLGVGVVAARLHLLVLGQRKDGSPGGPLLQTAPAQGQAPPQVCGLGGCRSELS